MERVADYIIEQIKKAGARHIFLVTGRGILYLSDAVAREKDILGVATYHEQGASYAAMAYAQSNEGLGTCLVSTGCAATNAITAVLCAWQDGIPCVFISGQHILAETTYYTGLPIRTYGSQETDIIKIVKPITKYAVMITDYRKAAYEIEKAIHLAKTGRKGPVWVDIPLDIQNMRIIPEEMEHFTIENQASMEDNRLDQAVEEIVEELMRADRPIVMIGSGVRSAGAIESLTTFIEKNELPLVYTSSAADTYGSKNRLSIGAVGGMGGSRAGNFAVQNSDYVLCIGSRLCSQTIGPEPGKFARKANITVVDIDEMEHKKAGAKISRLVIADAKEFLDKINQKKRLNCNGKWIEKCIHWKQEFDIKNEISLQKIRKEGKIELHYFSDSLSEVLPDDAVVITDAGLEELIIPAYIRFHKHQRCLFPAAQGAMGYAIPAIIGAYYAGKKNIVAVVGDGSVMMNIQELQTISYHHIPAKIIVINNNMYAVIRKRQRDLFRTRTIGNDPSDGLGRPDFEKIAESSGLKYKRIDSSDRLLVELNLLMQEKEAVLCEVLCEEEQIYFHNSFTVNKDRKVVRRPIEDLSPFLTREKFLAEMIIEPIDQ